jgi:hypothetical protein
MTPGKWAPLGNVLAVHGNEEDVLSDASASTDAQLDVLEAIAWPEFAKAR